MLDPRPDVVPIDIRPPGISSVHAIKRLGARPRLARTGAHPLARESRVEAIVAGASNYIIKSAPPKAIIAAVRADRP